jgi:hypothetical protein
VATWILRSLVMSVEIETIAEESEVVNLSMPSFESEDEASEASEDEASEES